MLIEDKLTILADAAKYDASCASSGSRRRNSRRQLGPAAPSGICHSYTEDGRCVSLLKILYTNVCIYDCAYCINRSSNDIPRAAFSPDEIVDLTIDFYRRNYIEGLFLSSGGMRSPDDTMEHLDRCAQMLRRQGFNGYIHLKCVPFASRRLIQAAGRHADRLSVNIELPTETSLKRLTGEKTFAAVLTPMDVIRETIAETREDRKRLRHVSAFACRHPTPLSSDPATILHCTAGNCRADIGAILPKRIPGEGLHDRFCDPRFGQSPPGNHTPGPSADDGPRHDPSGRAARQALRAHA